MLTFRKLPDMTDRDGLARIGRNTAIWAAIKEAREKLRDAATRCQNYKEPGICLPAADDAIACAERIKAMFELLEDETDIHA